MRTHVLAVAASAAALTAAAPMPAAAQGMGLGNLFSCQGSQGTTGTIAGALLGGLAGSQISKNERTLGAVAGAALGAWAGNNLACRMDNNGRGRAENAFERALETGRAQNWHDPRTGASGRVEVVSNGYDSAYAAPYAGQYSRNVSATDLRYARGIERIYTGFQASAPAYVAPGRVNVRAAPSTNAPVVNRLRAGAEIRAAGMVNGGWIAVEEDGWVQGYVSAAAVRPATSMNYVRNMDSPYNCRIVQQTVSMRGYQTEVQRFNACRDTAGQWRLNPI
jgi:surface antigen